MAVEGPDGTVYPDHTHCFPHFSWKPRADQDEQGKKRKKKRNSFENGAMSSGKQHAKPRAGLNKQPDYFVALAGIS